MILGIDCFNISSGGGVTHIVEFLRVANPKKHKFNKIVIWGSKKVLDQIEERNWLCKINEPILDKGLPYRIFWHLFLLKNAARKYSCDILLFPGGTNFSGFPKCVTMCRNLLPFQNSELQRFGISLKCAKLLILKHVQKKSFQRSCGLIYLTRFAMRCVEPQVNRPKNQDTKIVVIPHGISDKFFTKQSGQKSNFTHQSPFRLVYISTISPYKHQLKLVQAVGRLRQQGLPIELELIGPPGESSGDLDKLLNTVDINRQFIFLRGAVSYNEIYNCYKKAHMVVFASTCENMPNILLEGMASGLPVASSNYGPMPEILGESGLFFDPLNVDSICSCIKTLFGSKRLRQVLSESSVLRAQKFSWPETADKTLEFLSNLAENRC